MLKPNGKRLTNERHLPELTERLKHHTPRSGEGAHLCYIDSEESQTGTADHV